MHRILRVWWARNCSSRSPFLILNLYEHRLGVDALAASISTTDRMARNLFWWWAELWHLSSGAVWILRMSGSLKLHREMSFYWLNLEKCSNWPRNILYRDPRCLESSMRLCRLHIWLWWIAQSAWLGWDPLICKSSTWKLWCFYNYHLETGNMLSP
jgi:hypothetical protein